MEALHPKNSDFKAHYILPYCLAIVVSSFLCFGFCRFVINKEIGSNVSTTRIISNSILMTEYYMDSNLKCATTALEMYMEHNPLPKTQEVLRPLMEKVGVSGYSIFNRAGKRIYNANGGCPYDEHAGHTCDFRITEAYPSLNRLINKPTVYKTSAFRFSTGFSGTGVINGGTKTNIKWMKKDDIFVQSVMKTPKLTQLLRDGIVKGDGILKINLSTPNGVIVLDTCNIDNACNVANESEDSRFTKNGLVIKDYSEEPIVRNKYNSVIISMPFGGLKDAEAYTKNSPNKFLRGQANKAGQYFYVINVTFDKTSLNQQLAMIIVVFIILCLFVCYSIYSTNQSMSKSSGLSELSERTADKVTHLCNARLGEIRRYITKIVKDSMRVNNMNKELPPEMVNLLDRAFREVNETDLTKMNIEGKEVNSKE